jgi:hypothetical protein
MIRDRDRIYGTVVTRRLRAMGIRDKPGGHMIEHLADGLADCMEHAPAAGGRPDAQNRAGCPHGADVPASSSPAICRGEQIAAAAQPNKCVKNGRLLDAWTLT